MHAMRPGSPAEPVLPNGGGGPPEATDPPAGVTVPPAPADAPAATDPAATDPAATDPPAATNLPAAKDPPAATEPASTDPPATTDLPANAGTDGGQTLSDAAIDAAVAFLLEFEDLDMDALDEKTGTWYHID